MEQKENVQSTNILASDIGCEKAVIGYLLYDPNAFNNSTDILRAEVFNDGRARKLYEIISQVVSDGDIVECVAVCAKLQATGNGELVPFTGECMSEASPAGAFSRHCSRLLELWQRRQLYAIGQKIMAVGLSEMEALEDIESKAIAQIQALNQSEQDVTLTAEQALEKLDDIVKENLSGKNVSGAPTGFPFLDERGGLHYSDLIIVAAYPATGKTSLALDIMANVASQGFPVAMYSAEMATPQIMARMVSAKSGVMARDILNSPLTEEQLKRYDAGVGLLCDLPVYIDETHGASLSHITASIRALHNKRGVRIFFIDYLQLLRLKQDAGRTENSVLADAVKTLKLLATDLNVCIILLSQLSRNGTSRDPIVSKLRGSGEIEEGADIVLLLYRPSMEEGGKYGGEFKNIDPEGTALIKIAKGRNIGQGAFIVGFDGETTHFYSLDTLPTLHSNKSSAKDPNRPY